ncbi:hypothetical protein B0H11DRAFT_2078675 [Mycena galericulata]|nr:hypothetical protein B0H11DRAFT_2078675 [Mycena galericulata]
MYFNFQLFTVFIFTTSAHVGSSDVASLGNAVEINERQSCSNVGSPCFTTACCAGLFCNENTNFCSTCATDGAPCEGVPCCSGLFCNEDTNFCSTCTPLGPSCDGVPCCAGLVCQLGIVNFCEKAA